MGMHLPNGSPSLRWTWTKKLLYMCTCGQFRGGVCEIQCLIGPNEQCYFFRRKNKIKNQ